MTRRPVTLQINLAPVDLPAACHILPHQLRQWADQVDEVLLILDLHRSRGRYSEAWEERLPGMRRLIDDTCAHYSHARPLDVDYAGPTAIAIADQFFGGEPVPAKDRQGAPYYAYLFGLQRATHDVVLHTDSDMLFGGGSQRWIDEALGLMDTQADVLACNPLPGPPTAEGTLRSQRLPGYAYPPLAFRSSAISTRLFLVDRQRFWNRVGRLRLSRPPLRDYLKAVVDGFPPCNPLEANLSEAMAAAGGYRVDFLGAGPGMWSVHPVHRTPRFFARLPSLIADIESGLIPDGQRGFHDLNSSMVDWTGATRTKTQKLRQHVGLALSRLRPDLNKEVVR